MSGTTGGSDPTADGGGTYDYSGAGQPNMNNVTVITPVSGTTTVQASNQTFVVSDDGTSGTSGSTIQVVGGNNKFVVSLTGSAEANNAINVDGGNNQFVVQVAPSGTGDASSQGGNTVNINGGNSQFAVVYNYSSLSGTPTGNDVNVAGGNNAFVVSYQYGAANASSSPSGSATPLLSGGSGSNNQSVITPSDAPVTVGDGTAAPTGAGDNVYVQGGSNQFVVASQNDGTGPNVGINGNNNAFVVAASSGSSPYDFSGLSGAGSSAPMSAGTGGAPADFGGAGSSAPMSAGADGAPAGFGGAAGSNPFASFGGGTGSAPAGTGDSSATGTTPDNTGSSSMSGGIPSSTDINSLLAASPFGPLLNLPGVTAQTIFGNAGLPSQDSGSSGGTSASDPVSSPLGGVIGASSLMAGGGAPATGSGSAPAASSDTGSSDTGSSPATYDFSTLMNGASGSTGTSGGGSDLASLLRQSPFGALLDLPGVTPETLFGNLGSSSDGSSASGSNPFGSSASIGTNPFTNYPGTSSIFSASDPNVSGAIPTT